MTLDTSKQRSRRAFLGASITGGLAAVAAQVFGRPALTRAADGDPITVGGTFTATSPTTIENTTGDQAALVAKNLTPGDFNVDGFSTGIQGITTNGFGVHGKTIANGKGVFGEAAGSGGAGVWGQSGLEPNDLGVAVGAEAGPNGLALLVVGRARFTRSGRTMIPAGRSHVDISPELGLAPIEGTGVTGILATLQAYRPGVYVAAVRGNYPAPGKARIYLNKVASSTLSTPVTWFVLG